MVKGASNNGPASPSEGEAKAKSQMLQFYDGLEKRIKRYRPQVYAPFMARRLRECLTTLNKFTQTPPHRILHSIEANCAFHRSGYDEPIDFNGMAGIMNVYYDYPDLLQISTVHESLDRLFLIMCREQIELQIGVSKSQLAGVWQLFAANNPLPETAKAFEERYSLSIRQWIQLCFISCALVLDKPEGDWSAEPIVKWDAYEGTRDTIQAFISHSSRSVEEIGANFKNIRKQLHPMYHSLIRSVFLETPLMRLDGARVIAPHPHLVFRHAQDGLYRLAQPLKSFDGEFGKSFEKHIRTVLSSCQRVDRLLDEKDLKSVCRTKNCDFLLDMSDAIVLVECKACAYTINLFTDNAILKHNSTKKVADGLTQLYHVAKDVEDGTLQQLGINCHKPIMGIVVTFGEIPSANSDWYFKRFFLERASTKLDSSIYPSACMKRRPIVISAEALQQFVEVLNSLQVSPLALYEEKESENYLITGDWSVFLRRKIANLDQDKNSLPFITDNISQFLQSFGFAE